MVGVGGVIGATVLLDWSRRPAPRCASARLRGVSARVFVCALHRWLLDVGLLARRRLGHGRLARGPLGNYRFDRGLLTRRRFDRVRLAYRRVGCVQFAHRRCSGAGRGGRGAWWVVLGAVGSVGFDGVVGSGAELPAVVVDVAVMVDTPTPARRSRWLVNESTGRGDGPYRRGRVRCTPRIRRSGCVPKVRGVVLRSRTGVWSPCRAGRCPRRTRLGSPRAHKRVVVRFRRGSVCPQPRSLCQQRRVRRASPRSR